MKRTMRTDLELELRIELLEMDLQAARADGEEALDTIRQRTARGHMPDGWVYIDTSALMEATLHLTRAQERYNALQAQISAFKDALRQDGI